MWLLSPLLSPALSCGKQMWEGPSQPHIPRTERDLGSWSLPSPFLCTTCLQKVLLIWAHLAVSFDSTHSPASSQSFWTGLLLTSLAACSSIFWNLSHLMASSSVFITFLWIPDERNSQGRFLPTMVSDGFVSTMAGKHGRSSSVSGSSRRWRLRHISVNRQAEKDKSEPPKACPQWSTSATQAPPPNLYSLQNSATSWGLCAQDASLWGKFSVLNHDDWGALINSVQVCNKIRMSSLHLGLLCVTWLCLLFGLSLQSLRPAQVFTKLGLIYLLLLLFPHFSMFNWLYGFQD